MFYFKLKDCVDFETLERYGFVRKDTWYLITFDNYYLGIDIKTRKFVFERTPTKLMFLDVFYKLVKDGLVEMIEK